MSLIANMVKSKVKHENKVKMAAVDEETRTHQNTAGNSRQKNFYGMS